MKVVSHTDKDAHRDKSELIEFWDKHFYHINSDCLIDIVVFDVFSF